MKGRFLVFALLSVAAMTATLAGTDRIDTRTASGEAVAAAREMVAILFTNLKGGKTDEIAQWIVDQVGYASDAATKVKNKGEYKSQLDIVLISPPASAFGKLDGYDQIDEAYLPGSARFFRLCYISYHEGAHLVWEFRFYVKPDGKVALNYVGWNPKNPFEFLSTSDMLVTHWLRR